jgi:hypothetical protein
MASITAERLLVASNAPPRRAGWLLIAAAASFIAALLFLFVVGADYYEDLTNAAEAVGTSINGVPESERARIAGDHAFFFVISSVLFLLPYIVLAISLREIDRSISSAAAQTTWLTRACWWGGAICLALWVLYSLLLLGLLLGADNLPPLTRDFNAIAPPVVIGAASIGAAAVACAALALRRAGIATRIGLVTASLTGLFLLATLVESIATRTLADVPQFLPLVSAVLLGIGLVRSPAIPHR